MADYSGVGPALHHSGVGYRDRNLRDRRRLLGGLPVGQEWMLALAGVLSVLLGVLLAILPGVGLLSLVWLIGIYALVFGILLIIRAFQFITAGTAYT